MVLHILDQWDDKKIGQQMSEDMAIKKKSTWQQILLDSWRVKFQGKKD